MTSKAPSRILLGMTGGIAAYKAAELCRLLVGDGSDVQVVMSEAACRFVTRTTMQALSGKPVFTELWDATVPNGMGHIELSRDRDIIVVAPTSADFLAKLAAGLADDLLSTLCLARECPLLVAPAMNRQMWENASTQRNVQVLAGDGVRFAGPASGDQACGEVGPGRMLEAEEIYREIVGALRRAALADTRVLITAGPTFEAIDAVRGITNRSSGRMGYAVAQAALEAGAHVTLVSGPTALVAPPRARLVPVVSAQDMLEAVNANVADCDIFISVAAVADYRVAKPAAQKMKKSEQALTLELVPTVDILASVAGRADPPFCVGFAVESQDLEQLAEDKRLRKKLPLLAANLAQEAIGAEESALVLLDGAGRHRLPKAPKLTQARLLIDHIARLYRNGRSVKLKAVRR
ncbi:MAG TPA: bifunctional phosphopantothenoylcysteine decarboxylase/phosphopantothenate--cysteine ligase CoaBC [Burkholderiales bacterium]|nr:bifunctional phosphopantothenoylcysteine decarboxylase/phosphopantothenate--cysteine ligase CoaBC [Burkholderiales bacterium]